MKKIKIFLLAIMAFCSVSVHAQFKWGVEGGMNVSKVDVNHFDAQNALGWFIGPKAQFTVPVIGLGIDGALLYSQKSLDMSPDRNPDDVSTPNFTKRLPYLEIPVNLKYNIGFSSIIGVYVSGGVQYSWYLGDKNLVYDGVKFGNMDSSNFSLNFGGGVNLLSHLQLGVTYNIPLGKTGEIETISDGVENFNMKNNTWQIRLAYMF